MCFSVQREHCQVFVGVYVCQGIKRRVCVCVTDLDDEADGRHARGGHDLGTVGDQVEEDRDDGLCSVVKLVAQYC